MVKYTAFRLIAATLLCLTAGVHAQPLSPVRMALDDPALVCPLYPELAAADRQRLTALYAPGEFRALWADRQRLQALVAALDDLADDGLDPRDYAVDRLRPLTLPAADTDTGGCTDLLASQAYLRALHHLHFGRLERARWQPLWHLEPPATAREEADLLALASTGVDDPAGAFARARPSLERYRQLRQAYAHLRQAPLPAWQAIPAGPLLQPGMRDPRVPLLAERLLAAGYLDEPTAPSAPLAYGPALVAALLDYQRRHGLEPDGILGPATLAELNISPASRRDQVRANLERMRWLARDVEPDLLLVDIAGARLQLYRDRALRWQTRTQVGRAQRPTPELKSRITHLTLNPTWTVPPTILREDKLPEIRRDPGYLARHGLTVLDYQGRRLDPAQVDWQAPRGILLRQAAGPSNPLGQVAVRFANPFSVYLHDTPSQQLFAESSRTFSSGCVRVEGALHLVDQLLTDEERPAFASRLASGRTQRFDLARPLPILMAYWTVEVDADGELAYRPDVYGRDRALIAALNRPTRRNHAAENG